MGDIPKPVLALRSPTGRAYGTRLLKRLRASRASVCRDLCCVLRGAVLHAVLCTEAVTLALLCPICSVSYVVICCLWFKKRSLYFLITFKNQVVKSMVKNSLFRKS